MEKKNLARKQNLKIVGIRAMAIVIPLWFQNFDFVNLKREYFVLRHVEGDCETAYFSLVLIFTLSYHFGFVNLVL